jgi:hypothetical protein
VSCDASAGPKGWQAGVVQPLENGEAGRESGMERIVDLHQGSLRRSHSADSVHPKGFLVSLEHLRSTPQTHEQFGLQADLSDNHSSLESGSKKREDTQQRVDPSGLLFNETLI